MSVDVDHLEVAADFESIRQVEPWLVAAVTALGFESADPAVAAVHLAVHEVASNCVHHATTEGDRLRFTAGRLPPSNPAADHTGADLRLEVADTGARVFNTHTAITAPSVDTPQVRGYGLMIAGDVAATVTYERRTETDAWPNRWVLVFDTLTPTEAPGDR